MLVSALVAATDASPLRPVCLRVVSEIANDWQKWVDSVMELKDKYDRILDHNFNKDKSFQTVINDVLRNSLRNRSYRYNRIVLRPRSPTLVLIAHFPGLSSLHHEAAPRARVPLTVCRQQAAQGRKGGTPRT